MLTFSVQASILWAVQPPNFTWAGERRGKRGFARCSGSAAGAWIASLAFLKYMDAYRLSGTIPRRQSIHSDTYSSTLPLPLPMPFRHVSIFGRNGQNDSVATYDWAAVILQALYDGSKIPRRTSRVRPQTKVSNWLISGRVVAFSSAELSCSLFQ